MSLALRRMVWDDHSDPNDFNVIHEGDVVGRIYRMNSTGRETWQWTQIGPRAPTYGPNGGIADRAKAAFKAAWEDAGPSRAR